MPTYTFQCDCGVQFDGRASVADRQKPKPCPSCGGDSFSILPTTVSGQFNASANGIGPQNTGVHDFDTDFDRVVGQSAKQNWSVVEGRQQIKNEIMATSGATSSDLSKNIDGSYRVMTRAEKAAHQRSQVIHIKATEWLRKRRANQ